MVIKGGKKPSGNNCGPFMFYTQRWHTVFLPHATAQVIKSSPMHRWSNDSLHKGGSLKTMHL